MLIGPHALNLVGSAQGEIAHVAEYGVVMMLFVIGLELAPSTLWRLRASIFGLGTAQVLGTALAVTALALLFGLPWQTGLVYGLTFSLSSTAIVLSTLQERGLLKSAGGQAGFSVLLFQDLAVIPMLALLPLLALAPAAGADAAGGHAPGGGWLGALKVLGAVAAVVLAGRLLLRHAFRAVAQTRLRETFTAVALLIVVATAALMQAVGLSPALGAFLAGVVLADSEYRHQLEADLEPFKGLLMGLFFLSVGAGFDFPLIGREPLLVAALTLGLLALKAALGFGLARLFRLPTKDAWLLGLGLAQGGEFAFVLFLQAAGLGALTPEQASLGSAAVALSMAAAPLLLLLAARLYARAAEGAAQRQPDAIDEHGHPVIIAGFGRFGSHLGRLLSANGIGITVLESDADQVETLREFGQKAYFGDASREELLAAAGAATAKVLVVAVDDKEACDRIVALAQERYPHLRLAVRTLGRAHTQELINRGVEMILPGLTPGALELGTKVLRALGLPHKQALRAAQLFRRHDDRALAEVAALRKQEGMNWDRLVFEVRRRNEDLEALLRADLAEGGAEADLVWESARDAQLRLKAAAEAKP